MTNRIEFFKEAVKSLKTSGTVTPSSRYLAKKMISKINFKEANVIVELGPGNGAITKQILKKLHPEALLVCFEINEKFYQQLQKINHPQLLVLNVSAEKMEEELTKLGHAEIDHIISSLPLTLIPNNISDFILQESYKLLKINGTFIQYQYSLTYHKKLKTVFGKGLSLDFEPINFPPAFVYRCRKIG